jgi:hypothetical protein
MGSNLDVQNAYNPLDTVTKIKIRKYELLGHVIRIEDTCIPEIILIAKPEGRQGSCKAQVEMLR